MNFLRFTTSVLSVSLLVITVAVAQETIIIRGVVIDDSTEQPLKSVRVSIHSLPDSTLLKGAMTDAKGEFGITIPEKDHWLVKAGRIGYTPAMQVQTLQDVKGKTRAATIRLRESVVQTGDVEVVGWRDYMEVRPEKKVYTIKDNPNISATSVSDVLDQIPSVQVDENGGVRLRGDDNVVIMINDRPLKMETEQRNKFLQQLPAQNIASIEVRTAPGAKFDAKYNGGIINIILEKGLADFAGGNVYANGNTIGRGGAGGTLMYDDSTITGSLNLGWNRYYDRSTTHYFRDSPENPVERYISKDLVTTSDFNSFYVNPQVDITLSPHDILSLTGIINTSPGSSISAANGTRRDPNNTPLQFVADSSNVNRSGSYMDYSLLYKHTFDEESKLSADLNFSRWVNHRDDYKASILTYPEQVFDTLRSLRQSIGGTEESRSLNLRTDYTYTPNAKTTLEFGAKVEAEEQPTDVHTERFNFFSGKYTVDSSQTLANKPYYAMFAAFGTLGLSLTDDISVQAGLRYEHSVQGADFGGINIRRTYPNLFPSLSLSWVISPEYQVTASYNRSVSMPWVGLLNPRVSRESATAQWQGNPDIQPEFTHAFELSGTATIDGTTITLTPFYKLTLGDIRFSAVLDHDLLKTTYANFNGSGALGIDGLISYRSRDGYWASVNFNAQEYHNFGSAASGDVESRAIWGNCNGNIGYQFIPALTATATVRYASPLNYGGEEAGTFISTNLNVIYKMLDNAMTLTLTVADPFDIQKRTRVNTGFGYTLTSDAKQLSQFISLNIMYSFGKSRVNLEQHSKDRTSTKGEG